MQLHERLMDLIGHEVTITARTDSEARDVPVGIVKEVGPDFVIIGTKSRDKSIGSDAAVDWWVRLAVVVAIIHATDCPKCMMPEDAG